ncbi:MAG: hypothetical protein ACYC33_00050 [Thermoleophilia bacterium]
MVGKKRRRGPDLAYGSFWRLGERVWYGVLSVLAVLVIWGAVTATAGLSTGFCSLCHAAHSAEQERSAHAGIHCDGCHRQATAFGLVDSRLGVMQMMVSWAVPGKAVPETHVDSGRCLLCHPQQQLNEPVISRDVRMSHKGIDSEVWPCTRCHAPVVHGSASYRNQSYAMDMCLQCHNTNPTNPGTCVTCHPDGAPAREPGTVPEREYPTSWQVTHGPNVRQTHGMGNLSTCKACHGREYCIACHDIELPHLANFMKFHGEQALETDSEGCLACHSPATCENCHGVDMPHAEGFIRTHDETARADGEEVCGRCHEQESCDGCHIKSTHPGLDAATREALRGRPVR